MIITLIKAEIEAAAGWAVGSAEADAVGIDRELLTDPHANPWVPPSALAGSLRNHLAAHGADQRLMGSRPPSSSPQGSSDPPSPREPSALWLLGTQARPINTERGTPGHSDAETNSTADDPDGEPRALRTEVVANTAVDPVRGAALPQSLRHSRVVDEPTVIELYAMLEGELSAADRTLLAAWQPHIGRDRTRGGGNAQLRTLGYRVYDLNHPADLRAWVEITGLDRFAALTPIPPTATPTQALLESEFLITGALHVGTGSRRGKNAAVRIRGNQPLLPASSWKGIFRARASYIIRNCWGEDTACTSQIGCGLCPVCDLFGSTARRGRLAFCDSLIAGARRRERNHVAIDRVSGGGQDKLLFTDDVVTAGHVKLTINALEPVAEWESNLLRHVVRDLHDGLIGIGGGAQRGQGSLRLAETADPALTSLQPMPAQLPRHEASG